MDTLSLDLIVSNDSWETYQHFDHCAQAIEYSLHGYPIQKPRWMQATVGRLAFHIFSWQGQMKHNTNQLTPGAELADHGSIQIALKRLREAIEAFDQWEGALSRHEFYGRLTKSQHEKAHSMHISDHLTTLLA